MSSNIFENDIKEAEFFHKGCFLALPSQNKAWIMPSFERMAKKTKKGISFYQNDFFLESRAPWLESPTAQEVSFHLLLDFFSSHSREKLNFKWEPPCFSEYEKQFFSLKEEIRKRKLSKGVPFCHQISNCEMTKKNLLNLIFSLMEENKSTKNYLYGYWDFDSEEGFLGASPELLFVQEQKKVETYALAGTFANKKKLENDKNKLYREHDLVVDGMIKELSVFGTVLKENTSIMRLKDFSHLKSNLTLDLKNEFQFEFLLSALHPTPALGAFPKKQGQNWLKYLEQSIQKRFFYCSPFGVSLGDHFSLCIGVIRGLQWKKRSIFLTAGGGVIKESQLDEEWNEILLKLGSIKKSFQLS
jgi:isochorismate synthase EntC